MVMRSDKPKRHHDKKRARPSRASQVAAGSASTTAPSLASIVASGVANAAPTLRAQLLQQLLKPIGPLALSVVAGGAFAKYLRFARRFAAPVSPDDAVGFTSAQLGELARYVEQSDPAVLEQLVVALSNDPAILSLLGVSLAAAASSLIARRRRSGRRTSR